MISNKYNLKSTDFNNDKLVKRSLNNATFMDKEDLISIKNNLESITSDNGKLYCEKNNYNSAFFKDEEVSCNGSKLVNPANDDKGLYCDKDYLECATPLSQASSNKVNLKSTAEEVSFDNFENISLEKKIEELHKLQASDLVLENIVENLDVTTNDKNKTHIISIPKFTAISGEENSAIKIIDFSNKMSRVYVVNGVPFVGDERLSQHDNDELAEYQLLRMDSVPKDDDDSEVDLTTALDMHIQTLPQGVIINSNVFLWDAQWHTMTLVDMQLFRCAVCQVYCDRLTCQDHVQTPAHCRNLDKYKPLRRFDLSIVRKINVDLHCGVCNVIFDVIDCKAHENSKTHEENLLTAINKVCDLMFDSNIHTDYGQKNFLSAYRNSPNFDRSVSTPERTFGNIGEIYFDPNAVNNNVNVYEDFSEEEDVEEEEEEEIADSEECEIEEYNTPFQGISYASMASKPTIELPKFLKIDLGTKEVRVKFESWHMITKINLNSFYCMVCNKKDHIRFKSQHCICCEHVERLVKCTIVRAFEDYLIRKVDDRLYHCGHCNNLQYQNQIEDHIESAHPKKHRNYVETKNQQKVVKKAKTEKTVIEPKRTESDKNVKVKKNLECDRSVMEPPKINTNFDIFGAIPLTPFGCTLWIPALNFNLIMKKDDYYYCALCDVVCADVRVHVEEMEHVEQMTLTPFIKPFLNNLTRAVRGMFHCSLCNKLFPVTQVYNHNIDQPHTTALAAAMGMKKSQKRENAKRVTTLSLDKDQKLTFNLPPQVPSNKEDIQKENFKPITLNTINKAIPQKTKEPDVDQKTSNLEKDGEKKVFDSATVQAKLRADSDKMQSSKQNLIDPQKIGQSTQNQHIYHTLDKIYQTGRHLSYIGQNLPNVGQNLPNIGQNLRNTGNDLLNIGAFLPNNGQNLTNTGKNQQNAGQNMSKNVSNFGQNSPNKHQSHYHTSKNIDIQSVKSIPPMFNPMFPQLQPTHSQNSQFIRAPLSYNFNAPRPSVSPFTNLTPTNSPKLLSPTIPAHSPNKQEVERKATNVPKLRLDSRRESENSRSGSDHYRRDSDSSRPGSDNFRLDSDCKSVELSDNIETESLSEDECKDFDEEEMVFVKLKNTYFKITNASYHSLVFVDNGIRYCFVCSSVVPTSQQQKHVGSRKHTDFLKDNKFLDKYGAQLFRQMYLMYHCAICNELMTRKEIKLHLDWSGHVENYNAAHLVLSKKNRKELKSGLKENVVKTQKEAIYHNVNEPTYDVRGAYQIVPTSDFKKDAPETRPAKDTKPGAVMKYKMVIQNNVVMKIPFYHWHGIVTAKSVTKCIICQMEIKPGEVFSHVESEYHAVALGKTFDKTYYPALVRKVNECTVNCMTCNLELPNNEYMVHEHVNGRKHDKHQEKILGDTTGSDSYADCYEDYLNV